jgi:hypothetical protein
MKLVITRDKAGVVREVELEGAVPDGVGRIQLPNWLAVQITDKVNQRPIVGIEFGTFEGLELVQVTE